MVEEKRQWGADSEWLNTLLDLRMRLLHLAHKHFGLIDPFGNYTDLREIYSEEGYREPIKTGKPPSCRQDLRTKACKSQNAIRFSCDVAIPTLWPSLGQRIGG
jgi:hypothetical protein